MTINLCIENNSISNSYVRQLVIDSIKEKLGEWLSMDINCGSELAARLKNETKVYQRD